jgi:hypothetical protein
MFYEKPYEKIKNLSSNKNIEDANIVPKISKSKPSLISVPLLIKK